MFITHFNGRPAVWKTRRGVYPLAFESLKDGHAFLRWKKVPCTLATLEEILKINPNAFRPVFGVVYLPTRQAIEMFGNAAGKPNGFPTEAYLVTLKHDVVAPAPEPSVRRFVPLPKTSGPR